MTKSLDEEPAYGQQGDEVDGAGCHQRLDAPAGQGDLEVIHDLADKDWAGRGARNASEGGHVKKSPRGFL